MNIQGICSIEEIDSRKPKREKEKTEKGKFSNDRWAFLLTTYWSCEDDVAAQRSCKNYFSPDSLFLMCLIFIRLTADFIVVFAQIQFFVAFKLKSELSSAKKENSAAHFLTHRAIHKRINFVRDCFPYEVVLKRSKMRTWSRTTYYFPQKNGTERE